MTNWPKEKRHHNPPHPGEQPGTLPGQNPTTVEPEDTQRLFDLLKKIRTEFSQEYVGSENDKPIEPHPDEQDAISKAKFELTKTRARLHHRGTENAAISEGEKRSSQIDDVVAIPLKDIVIDREFQNTRLYEDTFRPDATNSEGQRLADLKKSMESEGQKTPIVVAMGPSNKFLLRTGFRRTKCAKELMWEKIRAIILPRWIKKEDEYWFNILENSTRKNLTTFETAHAARLMRDNFKIEPSVFAKKTGYSYAHVSKLLRCIDNLPEELIQQWRNGAGLSFDQWYQLSIFGNSHNAIETFRRWTGLPSMTEIDRLNRLKHKRRKKMPTRYLERMQSFIIGIQGLNLPLNERIRGQRIVEYCLGERDDVPGFYEPKKHKEYERRRALREKFSSPIPEPSDLKPGEEIPRPDYDDDEPRRH